MLQQEAASVYTAAPGTKSVGAISIFSPVRLHHRFPATKSPPPVSIRGPTSSPTFSPRAPAGAVCFSTATKALVRACFQQRRKQIGSLLRERLPDGGASWLELLRAAGLSSPKPARGYSGRVVAAAPAASCNCGLKARRRSLLLFYPCAFSPPLSFSLL